MDDISVLIEKSQAGDKEARNILIEKNLGLVQLIAKRFWRSGYESEDIFQIGCIGLIKSIDRFDLSLGLKFSTYAVPVITGEIKRFLRDDGPVKISRTIKENAWKISKAKDKLQKELHREPTIAQLCSECKLSAEDVVLAMDAGKEVESIYNSVYQEEDATSLADRMTQGAYGLGQISEGKYWLDEEKDSLLNKIVVKQLMGYLGEREQTLIYLRYFQNRTQMQTAKVLGISQVQVSRMEKKILLRLRQEIH